MGVERLSYELGHRHASPARLVAELRVELVWDLYRRSLHRYASIPGVRIIAGTHRGHRIAAPKGHDTRPTSDRVRENAFNLIGPVDDADVLDLFAGSGAMGLEALSRGAASATFVESDRDACSVINANLDKLNLNATVL